MSDGIQSDPDCSYGARSQQLLYARVLHSVVASIRDEAVLPGALLMVEADGRQLVVADAVKADVGQFVLVLTGAAAQEYAQRSGRVADAVAVAIADEPQGE